MGIFTPRLVNDVGKLVKDDRQFSKSQLALQKLFRKQANEEINLFDKIQTHLLQLLDDASSAKFDKLLEGDVLTRFKELLRQVHDKDEDILHPILQQIYRESPSIPCSDQIDQKITINAIEDLITRAVKQQKFLAADKLNSGLSKIA